MKKKFITLIIAAFGSMLVAWLILTSTTVHLPILAAVLVGLSLGIVQPKWGVYYVLGYFAVMLLSLSLLQEQGIAPKEKDVMAFCKYAVIATSLVGGFVGRLSKKLL
jgi:hypothetical protein